MNMRFDETTTYQERLEILVVVDDAVVNDHEFVVLVGSLGMRVDRRGLTVRSPACVRNASVHVELQVPVGVLHVVDELFQIVHFALLTHDLARTGSLVAQRHLVAAIERETS